MRDDPYRHAPRLPPGEHLDPREVLGAKLDDYELEIGPGRGWFLVERLEAMPEVGMVGLEIRRKWASIVDDRLRQRGLGARGRVFCEDARSALPRWKDEAFSLVFLHFPDPWWKRRHQKRLVLGDDLVGELWRILRPGGGLFIQTDVVERADAYDELITRSARFEPAATSGTARVVDHPFIARSPRERRAMADGLPIVRLHFRRVG